MKTITRFIIAFGTTFRATDIGAFFAPMFRPMITEQSRLMPLRLMQQTEEKDRLRALVSNSQRERRTGL